MQPSPGLNKPCAGSEFTGKARQAYAGRSIPKSLSSLMSGLSYVRKAHLLLGWFGW